MPSSTDRLALSTELEPATLQPVLRNAVLAGILVGLLFLVAVLPGAGRALPGTGLTVGGLGTSTVATGIVVTILYATRPASRLVRAQLRGPSEVVDDFAGAAGFAVSFVAVLVAHWGLAPAVVPLLGPDRVWMYDAAFLGFALLPTVAIAHRLVRNADVVAEHLTWTVLDWRSAGPDAAPDGERA